MPALISHYQFALRVFSKLKRPDMKISTARWPLSGHRDLTYSFSQGFAMESGRESCHGGEQAASYQPRPLV